MTAQAVTVDQLNAALEEQFAPWVQQLGLQVMSADENGAVLQMAPTAQVNRVGEIVCGQALIAAADTSMVIALYSVLDQTRPCATVDLNASFLKPATNELLTIDAEVIRRGRAMAFTRALVTSASDGKPVLSATATWALPPP